MQTKESRETKGKDKRLERNKKRQWRPRAVLLRKIFFKWIVMFCVGGSCCSETGTKSAVPLVRLSFNDISPPTDFSWGIVFFSLFTVQLLLFLFALLLLLLLLLL
jgi:hypothetical protein